MNNEKLGISRVAAAVEIFFKNHKNKIKSNNF
jgi:hypothetical protein